MEKANARRRVKRRPCWCAQLVCAVDVNDRTENLHLAGQDTIPKAIRGLGQ